MKLPLRVSWYHGSPNPNIETFLDSLTYVTASKQVALMYAKRHIFGTAKTKGSTPTIYKCSVVFGRILDLRIPSDQRLYSTARFEYNQNTDSDSRLPKLNSEGFLMRSGLPSFGYIPIIFEAIKEIDSIIVDDGASGITVALRSGQKQLKIVEKI